MTSIEVAAPRVAATGCETWPYTPSTDCDLSALPPDQLATLEELAQSLLWAASGRRYGICAWEEELRSCCCTCPADCCDGCRLRLTKQPVVTVTSVTEPGATTPLDPALYAVKWGDLVRLDGQHWPTDTACVDDGLVVGYTAGTPPPPIGGLAMAEMVCQLSLAGTPECRLPANVQTVTRQGVTIQMSQVAGLLAKALDLPMVSGFVALTNPAGMQVPSKVTSPDADGHVQRKVRSA